MGPTPEQLQADTDRLLAELRACTQHAEEDRERAADLLTSGYAAALALEAARRQLRARALGMAGRELALAAQEQELRDLLSALRLRLATPPLRPRRSAHEPAAQRLH